MFLILYTFTPTFFTIFVYIFTPQSLTFSTYFLSFRRLFSFLLRIFFFAFFASTLVFKPKQKKKHASDWQQQTQIYQVETKYIVVSCLNPFRFTKRIVFNAQNYQWNPHCNKQYHRTNKTNEKQPCPTNLWQIDAFDANQHSLLANWSVVTYPTCMAYVIDQK